MEYNTDCEADAHTPAQNSVWKVEVPKDIKESMLRDYRVTPLSEAKLYEYVNKKRYSMEINKTLATRWQHRHLADFKRKILATEFYNQNFDFKRDLHFHNGKLVLDSSLSLRRDAHHPYRMRPGPGMDHNLHQLPLIAETPIRPATPKAQQQNANKKKMRKVQKRY